MINLSAAQFETAIHCFEIKSAVGRAAAHFSDIAGDSSARTREVVADQRRSESFLHLTIEVIV